MDSAALVELALRAKACTQQQLAELVGVSPTQITKWKQGEHISLDMGKKLAKISGIGDLDPRFVLDSGSVKDAKKWAKLLCELADLADAGREHPYVTADLTEEQENLGWRTFSVLKAMGVAIPAEFPKELDFNYDMEDSDEFFELIEKSPHAKLIDTIYREVPPLYGFHAAYLSELHSEEDKLLPVEAELVNIQDNLMRLAAAKCEVSEELAPNFNRFRYQTRANYAKWLTSVKTEAFKASIPLKWELMDLVNDDSGDLNDAAEAESFGGSKSRIHPDVYMNELLVGMRTIHQVLPKIMEKLGLKGEFDLDLDELHEGSKAKMTPQQLADALGKLEKHSRDSLAQTATTPKGKGKGANAKAKGAVAKLKDPEAP